MKDLEIQIKHLKHKANDLESLLNKITKGIESYTDATNKTLYDLHRLRFSFDLLQEILQASEESSRKKDIEIFELKRKLDKINKDGEKLSI